MPMRTVAITTTTLPKNSTKSPTELIAATLNTFEESSLNACCPALQKGYP